MEVMISVQDGAARSTDRLSLNLNGRLRRRWQRGCGVSSSWPPPRFQPGSVSVMMTEEKVNLNRESSLFISRPMIWARGLAGSEHGGRSESWFYRWWGWRVLISCPTTCPWSRVPLSFRLTKQWASVRRGFGFKKRYLSSLLLGRPSFYLRKDFFLRFRKKNLLTSFNLRTTGM